MFECNIVMENKRIKEMTGREELSFVPFSFDLSIVTGFRQSLTDEGDLEDYSVVYTEYGDVWCIDVSYDDFKHEIKKLEDDNKTV